MAFKMKYQKSSSPLKKNMGFFGAVKRFLSDPTYKNKQRQIDMFNSDARSKNPKNKNLKVG